MNPNDRHNHRSENTEIGGNDSYWSRRIAHACAFS
jgi:hypothetical protein